MEGSNLNATIGRCSAPVPVKAVVSIINKPELKTQWDKLSKEGRVIEDLGDSTGLTSKVMASLFNLAHT